jgi:hypothetical protein
MTGRTRPLATGGMARFTPLVLLALLSLPGRAEAQAGNQNRTVTVNYVYASQIGIGGYDLSGLSVQVFTLPLAHTFDLGSEGGWRLKLKLPVELGVYEFHANDTDGTRISIRQQALAIVPGLELQIPLGPQWTLKPFADFGVGKLLQAPGTPAYIFSTGIKSAYTVRRGVYAFTIGNGLLFAGDASFGRADLEDYWAIENGIEIRRPLGLEFRGVEPDLGVYAIYYYYPKPLVFTRFLEDPLKISNQGEIGFSLGSASRLDLPVVGNPRIGVGYVFGGGLSVLRVSFGFPF